VTLFVVATIVFSNSLCGSFVLDDAEGVGNGCDMTGQRALTQLLRNDS